MSSWVAIDATTDRRALALRLAREREEVLAGGAAPARLRDVIVGSWGRSRSAGIDAESGLAPVRIGRDAAAERWDAHPLARAMPAVLDLLEDVRSDDGQVVLACDADGTLLWIDGAPALVDAAQGIHLERGANWSEAAAGTNAMGTALAVGHPLQVFSAEHFCAPVHPWTCSAAPVRDPASGEVLGVIDLSGELATAHPHTLAVVSAAARFAEAEIARMRTQDARRRVRRDPVDAQPVVLELLGSDRARLRLPGDDVGTELSRRHSELLALLALRPEGWSAEELAVELFGDFGKPVSVRAEVSRLRRLLGGRLAGQPYRLVGGVRTDAARLEQLVRDGDLGVALASCTGDLLPGSDVPMLVEVRERLAEELRSATLASGDPELVEAWLQTPSGREDEGACRALLALTQPGQPAHELAARRLRRLVALSA